MTPRHAVRAFLALTLCAAPIPAATTAPRQTDLLIVGATESAWAAAIQAARLGVKRITLVGDGAWLGGQYTEQSLACVDENKGNGKVGWGPDWHPMKRSFHRFGLFEELMQEIESFNEAKYGSKMPGKPYHGPSTFRPAEAQAIFRRMLQPYIDSGQVTYLTNHFPVAPIYGADTNSLTGLVFAPTTHRDSKVAGVTILAPITIDASDFGDAIQVSGTEFEVGPDPKERYNEPSAPKDMSAFPPNEMNPITWAMIVVEAGEWTPLPKPEHFDDRNYPRATLLGRPEFKDLKWDRPAHLGGILHWPDKDKASARQLSVYSVRRIVDGYTSLDGKTSILLNYMNGQDYPLERLPRRVADALEATEPGASRKNFVLLTREQRQIIFDDARQHSLGVLYHLQNFVHERAPDKTHSFRGFRLSNEFGTPDNLPPKPYIRESLRLKAMYVMREQDGRNFDGKDKRAAREAFAKVMYPDGVFCWQFHYDFHRTGRAYLTEEGESGPWIDYEKPGRHTRHVSDRSLFPLRSLVPVRMRGIIGAQRNIGNSSIVSAAIRLHDHGVHVGQAAGALAAICLREKLSPRDVPLDRARVEDVRHALCGEADGSPMLLWPFRDLPTDHPAFVPINRLAARGLFALDRRDVDFRPDEPASGEWLSKLTANAKEHGFTFDLQNQSDPKMTRGELARAWWKSIETETVPAWPQIAAPDTDLDGIPDRDDPLPFTRSESSWPGEAHATPSAAEDGLIEFPGISGSKAFNFGGNNSAPLDGFINDHGLPFTEERGHGWLHDISANTRQRRALPEAYRDTFLFTRTSDTWECVVPNGRWKVTLCVGDSGHDQPGQFARLENEALIDDVFTSAGEFHEATAVVEVRDQRLTLRIGRDQPGSNTCVNWIVLSPDTRP
jgi:hypothetical protein